MLSGNGTGAERASDLGTVVVFVIVVVVLFSGSGADLRIHSFTFQHFG